jgi:hypothetical protein
MFSIVHNPTFPAVCKITRVGEEKPGELNVVFRHLGNRAFEAWIASGTTAAGDADFLDPIIASWDAVDADGQPVPYSKAALATLLDEYVHAGTEIFRAYQAARLESRTGN